MLVTQIVAIILLIVGGLNWALVGVFDFDLVARIFGEGTALTRIVYVLVGLAALYELAAYLPKEFKRLNDSNSPGSSMRV